MKKKVVVMVCPSCKREYPEKTLEPTLFIDTGTIENVPKRNIICASCGTGLVRKVKKQ